MVNIYSPNLLVVKSSDDEGNSYSKVYEIDTNSQFFAEDREASPLELTKEMIESGWSEEDIREGGEPCIVFY